MILNQKMLDNYFTQFSAISLSSLCALSIEAGLVVNIYADYLVYSKWRSCFACWKCRFALYVSFAGIQHAYEHAAASSRDRDARAFYTRARGYICSRPTAPAKQNRGTRSFSRVNV